MKFFSCLNIVHKGESRSKVLGSAKIKKMANVNELLQMTINRSLNPSGSRNS